MPEGHPVHDTPLMFSAELACRVGLEGAVLVQQLRSIYLHQPATLREGLAWLHLSHSYLLELLPFWELPRLLEVCDAMEARGLLRIDRRNAAPGCLLLALASDRERGAAVPSPAPAASGAAPRSEAPAAPPRAPRDAPAAPRSGGGEPLPPDFVPSEDMLELLERFHGVPRQFALAQLEDFTLYWRERGSAGHAWQNRFKQHVQWHWKKHQQERAGPTHGGEHEAGGARRTRDSSLEHDLTDTSWAD